VYCRKCGIQIPDDSLFCTACGTKVENIIVNRVETGNSASQQPLNPLVENMPRTANNESPSSWMPENNQQFFNDKVQALIHLIKQKTAWIGHKLKVLYYNKIHPTIKTITQSKRKTMLALLLLTVLIAVICVGCTAMIKAQYCEYSYRDCSNKKWGDSQYCLSHICNYSGCENGKSYDGDYCYQHTCSELFCTEKIYDDSEYCLTHAFPELLSSSNSESAEYVLTFSDITIEHGYSYTTCTGKIKNNGKSTYEFVEVKGAFKNSYGTVLDTDWTYAVGSEGLAPGESSTFSMSVPIDRTIRSCTVTLKDYDKK